jgi:hypothetical protein
MPPSCAHGGQYCFRLDASAYAINAQTRGWDEPEQQVERIKPRLLISAVQESTPFAAALSSIVRCRSHGGSRGRYCSWPRAVTRRLGDGVVAERR